MISEYKLHEQASVDRRGAVRYRDFGKILIVLPPLREQHRIVEILDTADEAIHSTQRLIGKLEQVNRGLVHGILTVDAHEWLCSDVASEFDIKPGITLGPHRVVRNRPKPYLRVANVQRGWIDVRDIAFLEASPSESADYALAVDDLLIVEGHANPWEIGRCAIVERGQSGLLYQNHLFRLRTMGVLPRFALLWLNSTPAQTYWWKTCATSSGLNTINSRQLRALPFPVPRPEVQARVVEVAARSSSRLDAERVNLRKLRMMKQGLMDDLLRGRLRVGALA
jgi:type I restriction enzyme, S subunit